MYLCFMPGVENHYSLPFPIHPLPFPMRKQLDWVLFCLVLIKLHQLCAMVHSEIPHLRVKANVEIPQAVSEGEDVKLPIAPGEENVLIDASQGIRGSFVKFFCYLACIDLKEAPFFKALSWAPWIHHWLQLRDNLKICNSHQFDVA